MTSYSLQLNPRSRHIKIRVESSGEVVVSAPPRASRTKIAEFVQQSQDWINHQLTKLATRKEFGESDTTLMIFGRKYQKRVELTKEQSIGIIIVEDTIHINPIEFTDTSVSKEITRFLKSTAERYILPRTKQLAETMGISYRLITLRQQKTRWGSCSRDGNLNFNWRLVHCPPEVIDYVIIHELAHRRHMNHSDRFWQEVAKFDPAHREHRGWLKRHGMSLG